MDWKDVAKAIKSSAPKLGRLIGTLIPGASLLGEGLGGVAGMICDATGIESDNPTPDEVMSILQANPDAYVKLKEIESNHAITFEQLSLERDKMYITDVGSARARQTDSEKVTGKKDTNLYALAWLITIGFFSSLGGLMFITLPEGSSNVIFLLFGALIASFEKVQSYFFGSSKSSSDKNQIIAQTKRKGIRN